jgi:hypothetical protein
LVDSRIVTDVFAHTPIGAGGGGLPALVGFYPPRLRPGGPPDVHPGAAQALAVRKKVRLGWIASTSGRPSRNRDVVSRHGVRDTRRDGRVVAISRWLEFIVEK